MEQRVKRVRLEVLTDLPTARWAHVLENGKVEWDEEKIKCLISDEERKDELLLRNVFHGSIITAEVYPLIFDQSKTENEGSYFRSLPFFREVIEDRSNYDALQEEQKLIFAVGLRDLFFATLEGLLSEEEETLFKTLVDVVDEEGITTFEAQGMQLSFHPSKQFKLTKYVERSTFEGIEDKWMTYFAQAGEKDQGLCAVFVNPEELSYHNFENIIPLDTWFEKKNKNERENKKELSFSLEDMKQLHSDTSGVFTFRLNGPSCEVLKELHAMNLYVPPFNSGTRGGKRAIFHSAELSKALSAAVRSSGLLSTLLVLTAEELAEQRKKEKEKEKAIPRWELDRKQKEKKIPQSAFAFVNSVFRLNKFMPGDSKFSSHLDTPYYDAARSHVSKYTLIIYLTGGKGDPFALRVGEVPIERIEEMTCVIFEQKQEHEGMPYIDSEKVFLRSELIFMEEGLT